MAVVLPASPAFAATGSLSLSVTITDTNGNPITTVDASGVPSPTG